MSSHVRPESTAGPKIGPPAVTGGPQKTASFPGGKDEQGLKANPPQTQDATAAQRALLRESIAEDLEQLWRELGIADASLAAESDAGLLHGLRRAGAVWGSIIESARELGALAEGAP